jgi:selenocysteine lyase/cysteine desulfurase
MILSESQRHELFPVTRDWAYLNTAFRGPVSTPAADAAKGYIDGLSSRGVTAWEEWQRDWDDTHAELAAFIGAARDEVQILANATDALTRATLGIDWKPGDHAVVYERDYPGVVRPILDLRRRGVEVALVPERDDGLRSHDTLLHAVTARTRLVAASWVDFRTGFRLDVAALAAGCRARGVLCAIDAVQALGAMPVNVSELGADVVTFAARKYLNALDEAGALYIRREAIAQVTPHSRGTYSVQQPFNFDAIDQPPADGARRYMLGAPSMPQVYALRAALKLQRDTGRDAIHETTTGLAGRTREVAARAGLTLYGSDWPTAGQSHIVCIRRTGKLADEGLAVRLESARVAAAVRSGIVRVAPHWYNTEQDMARLFEALK